MNVKVNRLPEQAGHPVKKKKRKHTHTRHKKK